MTKKKVNELMLYDEVVLTKIYVIRGQKVMEEEANKKDLF